MRNLTVISPQPFKINTVSVDGQQKRSNRVFIDRAGFLANVLVEVRRTTQDQG